ncbi:NAD(P)/FAD-dependent oxidoreductase [Geoglobus acetivorans]|nr:NAD(P)/FAD-dependent oxidoreductase [Geoglobus acetivorans]
MKVAVIGAGLAGLNAGRILSEYADVDVYESSAKGGLAGSFCTEDYCIEVFYHHFFRQDSYLIDLLGELKLRSRIVWNTSRVGQAFRGKIYPLNTPLEILRYPGMSLLDKIRLAKFTVSAKKKKYELFDNTGVIDGLKKDAGDRLIERFFLPLLKSKFGNNYSDVSYAWLLARVTLRSNRKLSGEELGYLKGGFHQLIDRLSDGLEIVGERAKVKKNGQWNVNGVDYDAVVFTAPLPELGELGRRMGIQDVRYQSSICLLISMDSPFTDDLYWINYDAEPFGATIEHTNFMPLEDYGEHLMYVASYTTPDRVHSLTDSEIFRLYLSALRKYGLDENSIKWWKVFRARFSGPVYEKNFRNKITPYRAAEGFYIAGMTSDTNYPERSMNGSLLAGKKAAEIILRDFSLL